MGGFPFTAEDFMVKRVYSGMRPTGRLHLGNYFGALKNWVALQSEYDCIFSVVDVHALTTIQGEETNEIKPNIKEMVLDWLAAGLDPEKSIIYVQSAITEELALHALLSMTTPLGWLLRVPTFKDRVRQMGESEENVSYGLVGYPVLQTADIILFKADAVPVGVDQVPHIELCREIARRFNHLYGYTFPEPEVLLTETPLILGTDGSNKMSKSLDNAIMMTDPEEGTKRRVMSMVTDPKRVRKTDPGRPEVCNVYSMHKVFNPATVAETYRMCTAAEIGCVDCKDSLAGSINRYFQEFRERRKEIAERRGYLDEVLLYGAEKARRIAKTTLEEVYVRMGLA
jgi:tryptophanyl-tRNA synthetase